MIMRPRFPSTTVKVMRTPWHDTGISLKHTPAYRAALIAIARSYSVSNRSSTAGHAVGG